MAAVATPWHTVRGEGSVIPDKLIQSYFAQRAHSAQETTDRPDEPET